MAQILAADPVDMTYYSVQWIKYVARPGFGSFYLTRSSNVRRFRARSALQSTAAVVGPVVKVKFIYCVYECEYSTATAGDLGTLTSSIASRLRIVIPTVSMVATNELRITEEPWKPNSTHRDGIASPSRSSIHIFPRLEAITQSWFNSGRTTRNPLVLWYVLFKLLSLVLVESSGSILWILWLISGSSQSDRLYSGIPQNITEYG